MLHRKEKDMKTMNRLYSLYIKIHLPKLVGVIIYKGYAKETL